MIERTHLSALLLVAALIWGSLLLASGVAVEVAWLRELSTVIGVMVLLLSLFDLYLWRLPFLHPWFVRRPYIRGTWRAELTSHWVNPSTGEQVAPIRGFAVIAQTFSRLTLRVVTIESQSELLGAELLRSEDGTYRLVGVYRNEPKLSVRDRSPIHNGAVVLQIVGSPTKSLQGHYWTDRQTAGEMLLSDRRATLAGDYADAEALFSKDWSR